MPERTCTADDCERLPIARGMCDLHWRHWRKSLTPDEWEAARTPKLTDEELRLRKNASSTRYKMANPDKAKKMQASWLERNPTYHSEWVAKNRDHVREVQSAWKRTNPDKVRGYFQSWAAKNGPKLSRKASAYLKEHPEKARQAGDRRRAKKRGAAVRDFTVAQWLELLVEADGACSYCGIRNVRLEKEHKIPLIRGGDHTKSNIAPACVWCNRHKAKMTVEEFLACPQFLSRWSKMRQTL